VPPDHVADLRGALRKFIDQQPLQAPDDELLLEAFEEHLPKNPIWHARRELNHLRAAHSVATKRVEQELERRTKGLGIPGNWRGLVPMLEIRRHEMREGQLADKQWSWMRTPIEAVSPGKFVNLQLGPFSMGQMVTAEGADAIMKAVNEIWDVYPKWPDANLQLVLEPQIVLHENTVISEGTVLVHQSLDGTTCRLCVPVRP
jgi:hypothetical protein